jgi:tetratricopeptide (TPR) repeat protein
LPTFSFKPAVLKQLHHDTSDGKSDTDAVDNSRKEAMSPWLKDQLEKAEVLTVIEPYWTSLYTQNEASKTKSPPFFASSKSYYLWLAEWGRYMVEKSNMNTRSCYRNVFYACRSAVRSEAGLGVLEFLLPLLVLDALCFGNDTDKKSTVNELRNVLTEVETVVMHTLERQKSVECVFTIFQTLQYWAESEVEDRNKKQRLGKHERSKGTANSQSNLELPVWSPEESITVIEDLVDLVPFDLRSKAAARVGMHAQSLRCLEMHSRKFETQVVFNNEVVEELDSNSNENLNGEDKRLLKATHIVSMDVGLAHRLLGKLSDRDSMSALLHCQNEVNLFDQIYEKKSYKDWDSVLRLCELTSQIQSPSTAEKFDLENSLLEALLELGHFESVLKHIDGTINSKPSQVIVSLRARGELLSHAVKASWQLGRWDALEDLVHLVDSERNTGFQKSLNHDQEFDFAVGKAMLRLQRGQLSEIPKALEQARHAIIPPLSVVANEDYPRAYPYLLKLQSLREIEDAGKALSKHNDTPSVPQHILNGANFSSALDAETSMDITTVRLALARIGSDLDEEASLWLSAGRKARKEGLFHVAENSLSHANAIYLRLIHNTIPNVPQNLTIKSWEVKLQLSKVKYANGQTAEAIQMLNDRALDKILQCDREDQELANLMKRLEGDNLVAPFARCTLQVTEWMVESGLQTGSEAIERYKILSTISPKWERGEDFQSTYLLLSFDYSISFTSNFPVISSLQVCKIFRFCLGIENQRGCLTKRWEL